MLTCTSVQESCAIAKTTTRCALYVAAMKIFESPWLRPRPLVSKIFNGLLLGLSLRMFRPNLKFIALSVPEVIWGTQKNWAVPGYTHAPLSPKFLRPFAQSEPANVPAKFEVHSFKRSWDHLEHRINFGSPCIRPSSVFSTIFNHLLFAFGLQRAKMLG